MEEERQHAEQFLLFSAAPNFTESCSCPECLPKITHLKKFEDEIKSMSKLITDFSVKLEGDVSLCIALSSSAKWSKILFGILYIRLRRLQWDGGKHHVRELPPILRRSPSADKLGDTDVELAKTLKESNLLDELEADELDKTFYLGLIFDKVNHLSSLYKRTKVGFKAAELLEHIAELELKHSTIKADEAYEKEPRRLALKDLTEEQLKTVKRLPVEGLLEQSTELMHISLPVPVTRQILRDASTFIDQTCHDIIRERNAFWQQYHECPSAGEIKGHHLNGLSQTLDSLLDKARAFKNQWEQNYVQIFADFELSNLKRLQVTD